MDWKEFLEKGSIAVLVTASALYLSGMEYYLSLFHGLGTGVFFVVPMDYAAYEGIAALKGVAVVAVFCAMSGYFFRSSRRRWRLALAIIPVIATWAMPRLAEPLDIPRLTTQLAGLNWRLFCWGLPSCILSFVIGAFSFKNAWLRRVLFFWAALFLVLWSYLYSSFLGAEFATHINEKQKSRITFSDEALQAKYGDRIFHPVMEKGDELIILRFPIKTDADQHPKVMFVRREFVKSIEVQ
jgi:hypothetical protein